MTAIKLSPVKFPTVHRKRDTNIHLGLRAFIRGRWFYKMILRGDQNLGLMVLSQAVPNCQPCVGRRGIGGAVLCGRRKRARQAMVKFCPSLFDSWSLSVLAEEPHLGGAVLKERAMCLAHLSHNISIGFDGWIFADLVPCMAPEGNSLVCFVLVRFSSL